MSVSFISSLVYTGVAVYAYPSEIKRAMQVWGYEYKTANSLLSNKQFNSSELSQLYASPDTHVNTYPQSH